MDVANMLKPIPNLKVFELLNDQQKVGINKLKIQNSISFIVQLI